MAYEYFYPGTSSNLEPEYGDLFTGYRVPAGELGASTSVQTANQIKEVSNLLNQGMKAVEVSTISPEVFEMIPKQHLKEINRVTKLTGTETSLHAPTIDPSGFTQQGWNEVNREDAERQFTDVVKRGHELNPEGNIPVTIHASVVPGTESVEIDGKEYKQRMVAVNQETGEFIPLIREKRYYPRAPEGKIYEPEEELDIANISYWDNKLSQTIFYKDRGDELLKENEIAIAHLMKELTEKKINPEDLTETQKKSWNALKNVRVYLDNTRQTANSLFNQAYKFSDNKGKEMLRQAAGKFKEDLKKADETGNIKYQSEALQNLISTMHGLTTEPMRVDGKIKFLTPQIYKPIEDFTKDKASTTLGNVAFNTYKEFGDKSPIISIENPPYGSALARADELKGLVNKTRQKFIKKAINEGMSKSAAKEVAEKLIGVTWDTSHISMMRKSGFKGKKLIEEAEKIAPMVKHVHLNDNFGSTHTDLPPGMGDTPMKEILEKLKKSGYKGKKIFEGGNFFQHFQTSPHPYVLEAMGSPIYGAMMKPYWNQMISSYGNYMAFPSAYLPEQHFSMYGGGFSNLPTELGGQIPGKQSRATGTPMA